MAITSPGLALAIHPLFGFIKPTLDAIQKIGATDFLGYAQDEAEAVVTALVKAGNPVTEAQAGDEVMLAANQTPFYGESGGQMGDTGIVKTEYGYHVMYFCGSTPLWQQYVQSDYISEKTSDLADQIVAQYPLTVQYGDILLTLSELR